MYSKELQARLERFLKESNTSQAKAAPQIGISATALSQYRNSNYAGGNIQNVEKKILAWLNRQEEAMQSNERKQVYKPIRNGYVPTSVSEDIYKRIRYCQVEKGMIILHGDAGIGKTKAAEKYALDNPESTVYIQCAPSTGGLGNTLKIIANALGVSESSNRYITSNHIKKALIDSDKTLILDEAQHLKMMALEEIRTISDPDDLLGVPGCSIVLIGNTEIYNKMLGRKSASFAQLFSRIKMHKAYQTSNLKMTDIEMTFEYLQEHHMKKEIEFLYTITKSKWGLRGAVNVYNNAVNNDDVSFRGLYGMATEMGIGVL